VCVHDLLDQGDARSAEQLAMMYVDGAGVHNDYKIALKWLAKTVRHRCSGSKASSVCDTEGTPPYAVLFEYRGRSLISQRLKWRSGCSRRLRR